jgi:hypothetical protein
VDNFVAMYDPNLIKRTDGDFSQALFVDLGYGAEATTTLESAERLRRLNPSLPILGVEIDKERVETALPFTDERTFFRLGGFNRLCCPEKRSGSSAPSMLCVNTRKPNSPQPMKDWHNMLPGGLMIEWYLDLWRIWVANVARKLLSKGWGVEALVFSTNFRSGFDPAQFQAVLPKNHIHHVVPGEAIFDFFEAWKRSAAETAHAKAWGTRQWFIAAAEGLAEKGYKINLQKKWLAKGWLIWELSP